MLQLVRLCKVLQQHNTVQIPVQIVAKHDGCRIPYLVKYLYYMADILCNCLEKDITKDKQRKIFFEYSHRKRR